MMNDIARFPECLTGLDDPSRLTSIDARTDNTRPGNRTPAVRQVQSSFIWFHPDEKLAYFSYYSGGFRVASYNHDRLEEVGAFIDEAATTSGRPRFGTTRMVRSSWSPPTATSALTSSNTQGRLPEDAATVQGDTPWVLSPGQSAAWVPGVVGA
jgi:hypothetical protein